MDTKLQATQWLADALGVSPSEVPTANVPHETQLGFSISFSVILDIKDIFNCTGQDILDQIKAT